MRKIKTWIFSFAKIAWHYLCQEKRKSALSCALCVLNKGGQNSKVFSVFFSGFNVFVFFCFFGGLKGQVRWPEGPPHLDLNPPSLSISLSLVISLLFSFLVCFPFSFLLFSFSLLACFFVFVPCKEQHQNNTFKGYFHQSFLLLVSCFVFQIPFLIFPLFLILRLWAPPRPTLPFFGVSVFLLFVFLFCVGFVFVAFALFCCWSALVFFGFIVFICNVFVTSCLFVLEYFCFFFAFWACFILFCVFAEVV